MRPGVRCAEATPTSIGTSNSASACAASSITDQSLSLPMITPTRGLVMSTPSVGPFGMRQPVCGPHRAFPHIRDVCVVSQRSARGAENVDVSDLSARPLALAVQMDLGLGHPAEQVMQSLVHAHRRSLLCA